MSRSLMILVAHDLAVAWKSKTLILLVCVPLFVYGTLLLVDRHDGPPSAVRIGFLANEPFDRVLRTHMESASGLFSLHEVAHREEGMGLLKKRELDGLMIPEDLYPERVAVIVLKKNDPITLQMVQHLAALQIAVEGDRPNWLSSLTPLQPDSLEVQSMPTWILMVLLLVAFFVLPAQVAEEKEKQSLLGLLQTPMRESEWLAAKLIYGLMLMSVAVLALLALGQSLWVPWTFWVTLTVGCLCFGAMGIALGLLCRSQASARTFGVIIYLPLLLPAALSDASERFRLIAPFLPSHAFFHPIQSILLDSDPGRGFALEWLVLVLMGGAASWMSFRLIQARWLM